MACARCIRQPLRAVARQYHSTPVRSRVSVTSSPKPQEISAALSGPPPLPYLDRPLGMPFSPLGEPTPKNEEELATFSRAKLMAERRHLIKEVSTGYFDELNSARRTGGKLWLAPPTLIRPEKALYFPQISGHTLQSKDLVHTSDVLRGKITVVGIGSTKIADEHIKSYTRLLMEDVHVKTDPNFQFWQINIQENPLKSLLVNLFVGSLRKQIPLDCHDKYLLSSQNLEYIKDHIGMLNKHLGYIYLVDPECKIRWAAVGFSSDPGPQPHLSKHPTDETTRLLACTKLLLQRATQIRENDVRYPSVRARLEAMEAERTELCNQQHQIE